MLNKIISKHSDSDIVISIRKKREKLRVLKDASDKRKLKNKNFTIFSSNCVGGVIYHSLGLRFLSPTINLWIEPKDFIKILSYPEKYLKSNLIKEYSTDKFTYPVGIIKDVKIYGQHYSSFEELKTKWNERVQRINWNNVIIFMVQRDGCSYEDLKAFDKLPYKKKVVFTDQKYPEIKSSFVIPNSQERKNVVSSLLVHKHWYSGLTDIDKFDYVDFIITGEKQLR